MNAGMGLHIPFSPLSANERGELTRGDEPTERAELVHEIATSMLNLTRSVEEFHNRFARAARVSNTEIHALGRIAETIAITPKQLAEMLELTSGSVTSMVDRLEKVGLIIRIPNPRDRRSIHLALTDEGFEVMSRMYVAFQAGLFEILDDQSPDELRTTIRTLLKLSAGVNSPARVH